MDETVVRGLVIGFVFAVIGLIANMAWKLIRSKSEGARRVKLVSAVALVLLVGTVMFEAMGAVGAIISFVVIAACIWIAKGFRTKTPLPLESPAATPGNYKTEESVARFSEVEDLAPQRQVVITCPNCQGKLRVAAGKYIDVTCTHCRTVFRTHT